MRKEPLFFISDLSTRLIPGTKVLWILDGWSFLKDQQIIGSDTN